MYNNIFNKINIPTNLQTLTFCINFSHHSPQNPSHLPSPTSLS